MELAPDKGAPEFPQGPRSLTECPGGFGMRRLQGVGDGSGHLVPLPSEAHPRIF